MGELLKRESCGEQDLKLNNLKNVLIPPPFLYVSLPLRSVAVLAPAIDRHDGLTYPVMEDLP